MLMSLLLSSGGQALCAYLGALLMAVFSFLAVKEADIGFLIYFAIPFILYMQWGLLVITYKGITQGLANGNPIAVVIVLVPLSAGISIAIYLTGMIGRSGVGVFILGVVLMVLLAKLSIFLGKSKNAVSLVLTLIPKLLLIAFLGMHFLATLLIILESFGYIQSGPLHLVFGSDYTPGSW